MSQNFSDKNLQGRSFKDRQDLQGADFCRTDIRGANFTGANLIGADFSGAKAGLLPSWATFLVLVSWALIGLSGFVSAFAGVLVASLVFYQEGSDQIVNQIAGWAVIVTLVVFFFVTIRKGIQAGLVAIVIAVSGAFVITIGVAGVGVRAAVGVARAVAFAGAGGVVTVVGDGTAFALAALACARTRTFGFVVAFIGAIGGAIGGAKAFPIDRAFAFTFAFGIAGGFVLSSIYIGWQSLTGNKKYALIRSIAVGFGAFKGTSFRHSNLSSANFTAATLKSTDFRKANLTRTRFYKARKLDFARVGNSILINQNVLKLLVDGDGIKKSYVNTNLKGANLVDADLKEADLKDSDISESSFQGANLEWVNLAFTKAVGTDFTNARMTGTCIEAWNIERTTKLDNVDCRFIYLLENSKPGTDDRERRPSSGEFKLGEFTKLFEEVINTIDLIFSNGVDWKAFLAAFTKLQVENENIELAIQSIENKGDGVIVVKVAVPVDADKENIHSNFTQNYQIMLQSVEEKYKALLQAKEEQIIICRQHSNEMKEIVTLLANQPINFQVEAKAESKSMSESKRESNFNLQGTQFGGGLVNADTVHAHQISGNINNNTQEQPEKTGAKTILILAANPKGTSTLRLDEEVREIDLGLQRAKKRELFDLKQRWAVRVQDVYQALLDYKPQIVHFSGHGADEDGLILEDETGNHKLVNTEALANLFKLFSGIECIVLNACYSEAQAKAIVEYVPYVVGMNKAIGDTAAIKFATGFYNAVGAGESFEFAYKLGCNVIQLEGIPEHMAPVLLKK